VKIQDTFSSVRQTDQRLHTSSFQITVKQLGQNCHFYPTLNDKIRGIKKFGWAY